jgi:hypothetical protein
LKTKNAKKAILLIMYNKMGVAIVAMWKSCPVLATHPAMSPMQPESLKKSSSFAF